MEYDILDSSGAVKITIHESNIILWNTDKNIPLPSRKISFKFKLRKIQSLYET